MANEEIILQLDNFPILATYGLEYLLFHDMFSYYNFTINRYLYYK